MAARKGRAAVFFHAGFPLSEQLAQQAVNAIHWSVI
jgi:hypothetical protein